MMTTEINNATLSWDSLAAHLESFIASWEDGKDPPKISEHLPDSEPALRHIVLAELVKVDMEYRHQDTEARTTRHLEDYIAEHRELKVDGQIPTDLIYEEYHVRRSAGEKVSPGEYYERFPDNAVELKRLINVDSPEVSTAMFHADRGETNLEPGDTVDDFHLILRLGKGAFASVFLARQQSMQRLVALKVSADQGTEPQTLAQFDHPNIVRVYDQRQLPEEKVRLLYMQYVAGGTLQPVVEEVRRIPHGERTGKLLLDLIDTEVENAGQVPSESSSRRRIANATWPEVVCRLGAQLANALDYAHGRGVLHRDIKPANVLLAADGAPKLADFNISFSSKLDGATPAAYFGGSLAYMSPEQLEACNPAHERTPDTLDGRSDLYSLGVMLWELLLGQRPFRDDQLATGWSAMLNGLIDRRRSGVAEEQRQPAADAMSEQIQQILLKCLEPDPDARYQSGEELSRELLLCLQPRTKSLLHQTGRGWREFLRRYAIVAIVFAALIPHVLAGVFNYIYNEQSIMQRFLKDSLKLQHTFQSTMLIVNAIAYPLGVTLGVIVIWPVVRALMGNSKTPDPKFDYRWLRGRTLWIGHWIAIIGMIEWLVAGLVYPIVLNSLSSEVGAWDYLHFAVSMTVCGLIGTVYPFFFLTYLVTHVLYPRLLVVSPADPDEEVDLNRLGRSMGFYVIGSGSVPFLGIVLLLMASSATETQNTVALLVLSVVGFLGFLWSFAIYWRIQRDLTALRVAISPMDSFGVSTDTISRF